MLTKIACVVCAVFGVHGMATSQTGWTHVTSTGPSARGAHAMAFDSHRGRMVMFGGENAANNWGLGDTWEWDGSNWLLVATTGPSPRRFHAMTYDSIRRKIVLFAGGDMLGRLSDTWEWNGSTWTLMASTGPPGVQGHAMAYDSLRGRTVLYGGKDTFGNPPIGTWEWDGLTWRQLLAGGPGARDNHAMVYDSHRDRTVLTGGFQGDTWEWNGAAWTQVTTTGPGPRKGQRMAYDALRCTTLLFGGRNLTWFTDTLQWDGNSWATVNSAGPSNRDWHAMAYDSLRGRVVLFGGYGSGVNITLGDTWEWTGLPGTASTYGSGCGSPALALSPLGPYLPMIAATARASLVNVPSTLAFVALGWSRTAIGPFALPLPMASWGMPGCNFLQSAEVAALPVTITGPNTATFTLPIPNMSVLIGAQVYLQGWAFAPGVNPGETIVSNGLNWGIGY